MANEEHLSILRQGVTTWNQWRKDNLKIPLDLRESVIAGVDFRGADLSGADLSLANLSGADLRRVDLRLAVIRQADLSMVKLCCADLREADFSETDLSRADLSYADLREADFSETDLSHADFRHANLSNTDLRLAIIHQADFSHTDLREADLRGANLFKVNFTSARIGWTIWGGVDLSTAKGLETLKHSGPSTIGIDTITQSQGLIPEVFLKGVGVPNVFIAYIKSLSPKAIKFYSCFISYSTKDQDFAERLHADLQTEDVRCWFASEDMKIGAYLRSTIDRSIRKQDKVLLILTRHALQSSWVESEVEIALEEERNRKQQGHIEEPVLFPIRLDEAVMQSEAAWAREIKRTRHIGDFTKWEHNADYQHAFARLLRDLRATKID